MKIKNISPNRVFFPSKTSRIKDTLHVSINSGEKIIINNDIKFSFTNWGLVIDHNLKKKNKKIKFMGEKILDHLIFFRNKKNFEKYCKIEKQNLISVDKILKIYKC